MIIRICHFGYVAENLHWRIKATDERTGYGNFAFLSIYDLIHQRSFFHTRCLAGENKGVKPHGLNAVYPFGFMCRMAQFLFVSSTFTCFMEPFGNILNLDNNVSINLSWSRQQYHLYSKKFLLIAISPRPRVFSSNS